MIPVIRRLLKKGMPLYIAVVFLISGPILNPIVFFSTYMAFRAQPEMAYARMGLALMVAIVVGIIIMRTVKTSPLKMELAAVSSGVVVMVGSTTAGHDHVQEQSYVHSHSHSDTHDHAQGAGYRERAAKFSWSRWSAKWNEFFTHASLEFFEMGKYLVLGCIITAAVHTTVSRDLLVSIGDGEVSSHLFMMGFAYILSICSTSDAFVASSFAMTFSSGSLLAFLVFGPMMDAKTTLMMLSIFRAKFVLLLMVLIAVTVFVGSLGVAALVF
jgi:uncharacterized membrane protein YraQ (UPF0718 family)